MKMWRTNIRLTWTFGGCAEKREKIAKKAAGRHSASIVRDVHHVERSHLGDQGVHSRAGIATLVVDRKADSFLTIK